MATPNRNIEISSPWRSPRGSAAGKKTLDSYRKLKRKLSSPSANNEVQNSPLPSGLASILSARIERYRSIGCDSLTKMVELRLEPRSLNFASHLDGADNNEGAPRVECFDPTDGADSVDVDRADPLEAAARIIDAMVAPIEFSRLEPRGQLNRIHQVAKLLVSAKSLGCTKSQHFSKAEVDLLRVQVAELRNQCVEQEKSLAALQTSLPPTKVRRDHRDEETQHLLQSLRASLVEA